MNVNEFIETNIDLIDEFNYSSLFNELHYCTLKEQNEVIGILRQIDFFNRFHIECNYSLSQLNSDYIQLLKNHVTEISHNDIILIAGTERTDLYIDHIGFKEYRPRYSIVILPKIDYKYTYKIMCKIYFFERGQYLWGIASVFNLYCSYFNNFVLFILHRSSCMVKLFFVIFITCD